MTSKYRANMPTSEPNEINPADLLKALRDSLTAVATAAATYPDLYILHTVTDPKDGLDMERPVLTDKLIEELARNAAHAILLGALR